MGASADAILETAGPKARGGIETMAERVLFDRLIELFLRAAAAIGATSPARLAEADIFRR